MFEEALCIHARCVADVASLGVGDYELVGIVFAQIVHCRFEGDPALGAERFVKCEIRLICHGVWGCGVNDLAVKFKQWIFAVKQVLWYFFDIGIQPYA